MIYIFDDFALDPDRRELRSGALSVSIEPRVFDLLLHLIRHRERVVSRDELIESVWGGRIVSESALTTRINAVRSAIRDSGTEQRLIKTFPRKGVRFVGEVREEKVSDAVAVGSLELRAIQAIDLHEAERLHPREEPGAATIEGHSEEPPSGATLEPSFHFASRTIVGAVAAISFFCFGVLTSGHLARSAQADRANMNIETAAKLTSITGAIIITSREEYETVRALRQWAVDLDPHNADALADLTFAIVAGIVNQWSNDPVADLHAADLALQDAIRVAPERMIVRGARCAILRAKQQFEAAIKICGEVAQTFPKYPFPRKEIGYDKLMLGQLDEALGEFLQADRIAPNSPLRWSWQQGIGLVYLMQGQEQKAIEPLWRAATEAPNAARPLAYLASAYALAGREQEARDALGRFAMQWPTTTLKTVEPSIGTAAFNSKMARVLEGLRLAGLPE